MGKFRKPIARVSLASENLAVQPQLGWLKAMVPHLYGNLVIMELKKPITSSATIQPPCIFNGKEHSTSPGKCFMFGYGSADQSFFNSNSLYCVLAKRH